MPDSRPPITRRTALAALTLPALAACSGHSARAGGRPSVSAPSASASSVSPSTATSATAAAAHRPPTFHTMPIPHDRPVSEIPAAGRQIAITIDDGIRPDVIRKYADTTACTDLRVTFFANGCYDSWREQKDAVVAGIESGRIVVGNHTFSHPNLTLLSDAAIAAEITKNERHFRNLYGVDLKPYFRPPYGYINPRVSRVVRECGYDAIVLWNGTLGDDQNISASKIIANAKQYLQPGGVVIGHANHPGILNAMDQVGELVSSRHLTPVTVKDVLVAAH